MDRELDPRDLIDVQSCQACPTLSAHHVPSKGPENPKLMVIGQSPGKRELELKFPFAGPAGELLNNMLATAGLTRDVVYVANSLKCRPPNNRSGHPKELATCYEWWLRDEIELVNCPYVLLLGKDAYTAVIANQLLKLPGYTQEKADASFKMGNVIKSNVRTYIISYHPSYFLHKINHGGVEMFIEFGKELKKVFTSGI